MKFETLTILSGAPNIKGGRLVAFFVWRIMTGSIFRSRSEAKTAKRSAANPVGCTISQLLPTSSALASGQIVHHRGDDPAEQG